MADRIGKETFEEKVQSSQLPVVVDFYSDSCIACKKLAPVLAQAEEMMEGNFHFYKVNTNYEAELAEKYEILSNPTLIAFRNGQETARITGAQTLQKLLEWLKLV